MAYIEIQHVSKTLKKQKVLDDICMEMDQGNIYGIVGRNGSGKSVLMKSICGLLVPDEGTIWVNGKRVGKDVDFPENTGALIEQCNFVPYMSGIKNLEMLAKINKKIGRQKIKRNMEMVGLSPDSKKWVYGYSLGMKQRLALVQAFMEDPEVLILDEPMNSLDSEGVALVRDLLKNKKEEGKLVILSSHYKEDIDYLCDHVFLMEAGMIKNDKQTIAD